jgi:hypothetical protein
LFLVIKTSCKNTKIRNYQSIKNEGNRVSNGYKKLYINLLCAHYFVKLFNILK